MSGVALNPDPMRVLVVDDAPDLRDLITTALERTGDFTVVARAENGRQAVDCAAEHDPDLVLLDIAMPVMDGLEALPLVRRTCPDAILVMLSGFGASEMTTKALAGSDVSIAVTTAVSGSRRTSGHGCSRSTRGLRGAARTALV